MGYFVIIVFTTFLGSPPEFLPEAFKNNTDCLNYLVKEVVKQYDYMEVKNNNKSFVNKDTSIKKVEKKIGFKISNNQKIIEYSPLALKYLKNISKKISDKKGALLINFISRYDD